MAHSNARALPSHSDDERQTLRFVALTGALSTPFWLLGGLSRRQIIPGLPLSALMTVCPLASAVILTHRSAGRAGVAALLSRVFDAERIPAPGWYLPTLLLNPAAAAAVYRWQLARGVPVPPLEVSAGAAGRLALMFLVAAVGEEAGWSGYALDPLLRRWGPFRAGLFLGVIWAAWHLIPYLQAGRSREWIAWQCLKTVLSRVLIVWLYTKTGGSVFTAVLFHASDNLSAFLYPRFGSHYDPRATAIALTVPAALALRFPNAASS